jgi:hypothetical protein
VRPIHVGLGLREADADIYLTPGHWPLSSLATSAGGTLSPRKTANIGARPRRPGRRQPAARGPSTFSKPGLEVYPHQLRAGDVIVDEAGAEWELLGRPTRVVSARELKATVPRVDRPADMREERWRAHERVMVKRA